MPWGRELLQAVHRCGAALAYDLFLFADSRPRAKAAAVLFPLMHADALLLCELPRGKKATTALTGALPT